MKLKKTLSVLIGGICLVAATTVALAGPWAKCVRCNGDMPGTIRTYNVNGSHEVAVPKKTYSYICYYTDVYRKTTFRCSRCGNSFTDITWIVKHNLNHK